MYAIKEHATSEQRQQIDDLLKPPVTARQPDGTPAWYGSDDDAWAEFRTQSGPKSVGLG